MALSAFFVYFPITDPDIFWHLAAGREMVAHRHFLFTDPFAFTLASPRWIDLHWLFQLLVYALYSIGTWKAIIGFKLFIIAGSAVLLCLTHRSPRYRLAASFLTTLLLYTCRYLLDVRPILITMLFMASYVFLFEHAGATGKKKSIWWCVPLQIIWVNCQGLYMLGLFIIVSYWAEGVWNSVRKKVKMPALETAHLAACVVACLFNPYGFSGLFLPFKLFFRITPALKNIYSFTISENVPLLSLIGFESSYRTAVIIIVVIALVLFVLNRKKLRPAHVLLFAGFTYLAFSAVRNVPLYVIIIVPVIGYNAAALNIWGYFASLALPYRRILTRMTYTLALAVLIVPCVRHAAIVATCPPGHALSPFRFPEKCVAYLKNNPLRGEMFNDIRYGGYLIWQFFPAKKVFIDTRLIIRSPEFFSEYLAVSDHPGLFAQVAEKFDITHAVLPSALFSRHATLIRWLYGSDTWHLEYTDGESVLFVRNDVSQRPALDLSNTLTVQKISDSLQAQWSDAPHVRREALRHFSDLLKILGVGGTQLK